LHEKNDNKNQTPVNTKFFVAFFIVLSSHLYAEVRQGVVLDIETRKPIARASVYINGSTFGTSCNDEGVFFLHGFPTPPYKIHISAIGYETEVFEISKTSEDNTITIFLKPKNLELQEFVVQAPVRNGWRLYGKKFIEDFIGYSNFAAQCKILNPEVLQFFYDENERILQVYAEEPLIIENNALGYKITYWLDHFGRSYKTGALSYQGSVQFKDLITERTRNVTVRRWQENRLSAYNGSIQHFIVSLYHNRTEEEGFEVRPMKIVTDPALIKDNEVLRKFANGAYELLYAPVNPQIFVQTNSNDQKNFSFGDRLQIVYKNEIMEMAYMARHGTTYINGIRQEDHSAWLRLPIQNQISVISLLSQVDKVTIHPNGYFEPLHGILQMLYWSYEKLDKLVPLDYKKVE